MRHATLCFLINEEIEEVLLGMKKRGFGKDKWNGFGGKISEGETIEDGAKRELHEESGIRAIEMEKFGELTFFFPSAKGKSWDQIVHVFVVKDWEGTPVESEEMFPKWFKLNDIPFEKMWEDDKHWIPKLLNKEKFKAEFTFGKDNETITNMKWKN